MDLIVTINMIKYTVATQMQNVFELSVINQKRRTFEQI